MIINIYSISRQEIAGGAVEQSRTSIASPVVRVTVPRFPDP